MSEPISDNLVNKLIEFINAVMDEAVGDYLSKEQSRQLHAAIELHTVIESHART
jgi:hypothetical protein